MPSLPFSFFNPEKAAYETIWTPPIPLTINAAERVALPEGAAATGPQPSMAPLVETAAGLRANHSNVDAMLADHGGGFGAVSIAFFAAMPIVFLASWFIARRSDLYQSDVALRRRRFALSTARRALDKAARSSSAPAIGAALLGYVADRYNAPSAGMTRADAVARLHSSQVSADVVNEMNGLLESMEFAQYGGMAGVSIDETTSRARRIIDGLEKIEL
ncbi:MAG: BatD family protein [Planctomycetes bacterium]|nr:BatD family protein [Planctomycetota bacterium]